MIGKCAAQAVNKEADLLGKTAKGVYVDDLKEFIQGVNVSITGVQLKQDEFDALVSLLGRFAPEAAARGNVFAVSGALTGTTLAAGHVADPVAIGGVRGVGGGRRLRRPGCPAVRRRPARFDESCGPGRRDRRW